MKTLRTIMLIAIMLLVATSAAIAQTTSISYTDSYRWHGFEAFGDRYVHPGIATEVIDGVDITAITHYENNADDLKYWDTAVGYTMPLVDGLNVRAGYGYLILPTMDAHEMSLTVGLPGTISPRYTISHIIPDKADTDGQIHVFGVDVALGDLAEPNAISGLLSAEATFNDGVNPFGQAVRDWTHVTAGLAVNVPLGDVILQPAVIYQHTFVEAINPDKNDVWYCVGVKYKF